MGAALEFTVRRDQTAESILQAMSQTMVRVVTVRGCGTVLNTVCKVVEVALHTGWLGRGIRSSYLYKYMIYDTCRTK